MRDVCWLHPDDLTAGASELPPQVRDYRAESAIVDTLSLVVGYHDEYGVVVDAGVHRRLPATDALVAMPCAIARNLFASAGLAVQVEAPRGFGRNGYADHAGIVSDTGVPLGFVAWGGASQRRRDGAMTAQIHIDGHGCEVIGVAGAWIHVANWIDRCGVKISRIDIAHDCYNGEFDVDDAVRWYRAGAFTNRGRSPKCDTAGDWVNMTPGRTFYVGDRANGKLCRVYHKGVQLGDPDSKWTRFEVEWRARDRVLISDMLRRPHEYLAGAYPCLAWVSRDCQRIETICKKSEIQIQSLLEFARIQYGRLLNYLRNEIGMDDGEIVAEIVRSGVPGRLAPTSVAHVQIVRRRLGVARIAGQSPS